MARGTTTSRDTGSFPYRELPADARCLLDAAATTAAQQAACEGWYERHAASVQRAGTASMSLPTGLALSPADAARCVLDPLRTARFAQAVDAAIDWYAPPRGEPVDVLYAGCGPLAPLALIGGLRHAARRWRLHLVDVHAASLAAAAACIEREGLGHVLGEVICADAAQLRLPANLRPSILIAEVMQRALAREPQLAVLANLAPQCAREVRLIPRTIAVSAALSPPLSEWQPGSHTTGVAEEFGPLLELSRATLPDLAVALRAGADALPERVLQMPRHARAGGVLMLRTHIRIDATRALAQDDSGLTAPQLEFATGPLAPGARIGVRYRLRGEPGFVSRRLD